MMSLLAGLPLMIGVALGMECRVGDVEPGGPRRGMHGSYARTGSLAADSLFRFHSRFWPNRGRRHPRDCRAGGRRTAQVALARDHLLHDR